MVSYSDERGQLILVGSLLIAFVVVLLAIVFNGAIFAPSLADTETRDNLATGDQFDRRAARDVQRLILYLNHRRPYASQTALETAVRSNLSRYTQLQAESRGIERTVYVNVSLTNQTGGTRVVQTTDGPFTDDGRTTGDPSWTPVAERRAVGWAVLNLDAANVSDESGVDRFTIELTDDDGDSATLYLSRNTTTGQDSKTVDVETVLSNGTSSAPRPCAPSQDRLLLDLRAGGSFGGSCSFNLTEGLDREFDVAFRNGRAATGKYAVVTGGPPANTLQSGTYACPVDPGPCNAPVVWELTVQTTAETPATTVRNTQTVGVYP